MDVAPPTRLPWLAVVDDDRELQDMMRQVLAMLGWGPIPITTASGAFERIVDTHPDAVILDLHLESREAGWRVLEQLTTDPRTGSIPIIIWSGDVRELEEKGAWFREHSIAVLPKPFEMDELALLLDNLNPGSNGRDVALSS
jgi:CheY-like chemotaxis protein